MDNLFAACQRPGCAFLPLIVRCTLSCLYLQLTFNIAELSYVQCRRRSTQMVHAVVWHARGCITPLNGAPFGPIPCVVALTRVICSGVSGPVPALSMHRAYNGHVCMSVNVSQLTFSALVLCSLVSFFCPFLLPAFLTLFPSLLLPQTPRLYIYHESPRWFQ